jgi:xanthine/uracil permease
MKERLMAMFIAGLFLIIIGVSLLQVAHSGAATPAPGQINAPDNSVRERIGMVMLAIGTLLALGSLITQARRRRREGPHS